MFETVIGYLVYIASVAGMFLILIAPHEAGHFLVAKLCRVRVLEFSIGAGTKLWSVTRGGTLYALRLLPILGYVRMGGMEAGEFEQPDGFHSRPAYQRIAILAAGPVANFLVAMVLITGFGLTQLNGNPGKVVSIIIDSPASVAGIQAGDQIKTIDGKPVNSPGDIAQQELAAAGRPVTLTGTHSNGQPFSIQVTPACKPQSCQMGVEIARVVTPLTAVTDGVRFPFQATQVIFQGLGSLVTGQVKGGLLGPDGLTGPIGIAKITTDTVNQGLPAYVWLVALLSVALGITNLLPLLALDGGRIVVVIVEWLRRRPFDRNSELSFQRWGLAALLALAALISFLDIQRLATGQFPGVH
ncbi:MAG: site-2 protease family protein [Chloroflexi bacterium]|nr:MAG: site-2 protease family protein [Chloroflexota bacterium]TME91139.1 MAG: site-2 protease family protein [Chloroflexota bacterium]